MARFLKHFSGFIVAMLVAWGLVLYYEEDPIVTFERSVNPATVSMGDILLVESLVVRDRSCHSIVNREFISNDGRVIKYQPVEIHRLPKGIERYKAEVKIPEGLIPGKLVYRVKTEFRCNPIQELFGGREVILPDVILTYVEKNKE